jgi:hypothetical protein
MFTSGNKLATIDSPYVQSEEARKFLGDAIWDPYGRYVGALVGFCIDPSGEISSIGVDLGTEGFREFESDRFRFENGTIVVTAKWEAECREISQNLGGVQERLGSLKQLARQMGIPRSKVDQLIRKSDRELYAFLQRYKLLSERMALRGFEIESQADDLDDFVTSLTVQRNAGNIDEASYGAIIENCRVLRTRNLLEVEHLSRALKSFANAGQAKVMGRLGQIEEEPEPASTQRRAKVRDPQLIAEMP